MSHIDDLVKELSPKGVEFRRLSSLGRRNSGTAMTASKMKTIAVPGGPVRIFAGGQTVADVAENAVPAKDIIREPSIIVKSRGNVGFTFYERPFSHKSELWSYTLSDPDIEQKFVYYYLLTKADVLQEIARATSVKLPQLGVRDTDSLRIPVPPIEVQRQIVRILDNFTELEAELEAELTARWLQYQHYCGQLLTFDQSVQSATLGEICQINRGRVMSKDYLRDHSGPYPVYSSQTANAGVFGFIDTFDYDSESITWTTDGANAGSVFYHHNESFSITNVCGLLKVRSHDRISTRFLFYMLGQLTKKHVREGMGNPKLMSNIMSQIKVPIPAIETQQQIVAVLDRFELLVNDLSIGLPAELAARRKQYEYYRDRLLTFEEVTA